MDTIFALSSGSPPSAIAIVRISGGKAGSALEALAGSLPSARKASVRNLRSNSGDLLDRALVLWLPGPSTATGEDMVELHLHGSRAVVAAVERSLDGMDGLRQAEAGEFTRRAFLNGRMDLAQTEGLADLLAAETELQRKAAVAMTGGALSQRLEEWLQRILRASAQVEAALDFDDEDDVAGLPASFGVELTALADELETVLDAPRAERLRNGYRVVLAGPTNAGKSSLFNALLADDAAIVSDIAGTTRDVLERSVAVRGVPFLLMDTAGLRTTSSDPIERTGMERSVAAMDRADLVVWLGSADDRPAGALQVRAKADLPEHSADGAGLAVSSVSGEGVETLWMRLVENATQALQAPNDLAVNDRQARWLGEASRGLREASSLSDPILIAEALRTVRTSFDAITGRATTEDVLDTLFGRFCIGK